MSSAAPIGQSKPSFREFQTDRALYNELAHEIAQRLTAAASRNGRASLIVPGGTTPGAMFDILAHCVAPWENIEITLSDDRWIETGPASTNENLVRTRLLTANARKARLIPLRTAHNNARVAEHDVNAAIAAMHRPFDAVVLGMGTDGHIASLIPGAADLSSALNCDDCALARAIDPPDAASTDERMTLTLRAFLSANWIALLIRGSAKLVAYKLALAGTGALESPVRGVLHQTSVPVSVFWCP